MKITKTKLKQIIKEVLDAALNEEEACCEACCPSEDDESDPQDLYDRLLELEKYRKEK
jgi:hypothetical protein